MMQICLKEYFRFIMPSSMLYNVSPFLKKTKIWVTVLQTVLGK